MSGPPPSPKTHCVCHRPHMGESMMGCNSCNEWYHPECCGIPLETVSQCQYFLCAECSANKCFQCFRSKAQYENERSRGEVAGDIREELVSPRYCFCGGEDIGTVMVECARCQEWYHGECIGLMNSLACNGSEEKLFVCDRCTQGRGNALMDRDVYEREFEDDCTSLQPKLLMSSPSPRFSACNIASGLHSREIHGSTRKIIPSLVERRISDWKMLNFLDFTAIRDLRETVPQVVSWSPRNNIFCVGSSQGHINLFSLDRIIHDLSIDRQTPFMLPANKSIQSTLLDSRVGSFSLRGGQGASAITYTHDGRVICTGTKVGGIEFHDASLGGLPFQLFRNAHRHLVRSLQFSSKAPHVLLSSSFDKGMKLWDTRVDSTTLCSLRLEGFHTDMVCGATFVDNDRFVLSTSKDRTIKLFDLTMPKAPLLSTSLSSVPTALDLHINSQRIAINCEDGRILLMDVADMLYQSTSTNLHVCRILQQPSPARFLLGTEQCRFSQDGACVAAVRDGSVSVWDVANGQCVRSYKAHSEIIHDFAWCPHTPDTIVSCSEDNTCGIVGPWRGVYDPQEGGQLPHNHVLARQQDGRYYHATVLMGAAKGNVEEIKEAHYVKFVGWTGAGARAHVNRSHCFPCMRSLRENKRCRTACHRAHTFEDIQTILLCESRKKREKENKRKATTVQSRLNWASKKNRGGGAVK